MSDNSRMNDWLRGKRAEPTAEPESGESSEPLGSVDAGAGEPTPLPRMGEPEPLTLNEHIREVLHEKQLRRWRVR